MKKKIEYNKLQKLTLIRIKKLVKSARFIDLVIRADGKNKIVEADFLKEIIRQL